MRQKHLIYALILSCLLGSSIARIAFSQQSVEALRAAKDNAERHLETWKDSHEFANDELNEMIRSVKRKYDMLSGITVNTAPAGDYVSVTHRGASSISVIQTTYTLSESLKQSLITMEQQREKADNIWYIDVDNAFVAFENAVDAFNSHRYVSPEEHVVVYDLIKPHVESLYVCQGRCYKVFETLPLAMYSHSETCSEKHGSSGSSRSYWSCEYNVCPVGNLHWKVCRASACSVLFPPPEHEHEYDYYDHKVKGQESVYDFWNPNAICGEEYYTCEHPTCPKSNTHWSGSGSTPPPPTDNTPNCPDCTSDCSSPCGCTNSGTCGGTVTGSQPPSDSNPPSTVSCGRSACTESVSSSKQHKSDPCAAGHTYWTCNPTVNVTNWLNKHRVRTCRYSECGRNWQQCVTGTTPICNKPYRKRNGLKCWAE